MWGTGNLPDNSQVFTENPRLIHFMFPPPPPAENQLLLVARAKFWSFTPDSPHSQPFVFAEK